MDLWLPYLQGLSEQAVLESPLVLAQLFTLDLAQPQVASIQESLASLSEAAIHAKVDAANLLDDEWPGLVAVAKAYLVWCAFVDAQNPQNCFDLYAHFVQALQQAYANYRGSCLNLVVRHAMAEVSRLFGARDKSYLEWLASGLLRLFNAVRSERDLPSPNAPSKKENAVFYANMISRVYFRIGQFVSAGNVFDNMHSVGIAVARVPASELVEYRFWLGRYLLYRSDLEAAFVHLNWAYTHCLAGSAQEALVLDWLVVPSILVGRLPNQAVIGPLISRDAFAAANALQTALRTGVYPPNYADAVLNNPWVAARHLRPVIEHTVPLLVYRRGVQRLLRLAGAEKLSLALARAAFRLSADEDPDLLRTEGICETLISRGMLKGNILPASQMLLVKSHGSVPPLLEVNQVLTRPLPERDQWLQP